ncbi:MAG: sulfur carrier protein ThiS adenylyltransferase ThiF [Candidatus Methanomethylophilaceae archaeon]
MSEADNLKVGIAGLGGLGSNVAMMLVRSGVRNLVLADFDTVEESNLNRQIYFRKHIGMKKTEACSEILKLIDSGAELELHDLRLTEKNIPEVFKDCRIICEGLDTAEDKAMLAETVLSEMKETYLVSGSGISGFGTPNTIVTVHRFGKIYVCGDGTSDDMKDMHAPRVLVCAGHQANQILRLIHEMEDENNEH